LKKRRHSKLPPSQIKKIRIILEIIDNLKEVPEHLVFYKNLRPHLLAGGKRILEFRRYWKLQNYFSDLKTKKQQI
jgi:hypothetical protein